MQPAQLALGDPVINSIGMVLVPIPEGEFTTGDRKADATQYPVKIGKAFHLGALEMTQDQYEKVMGKNRSHFKGAGNLPVERVSWKDTVEFCRKLSALPEETAAGRAYRLPTEAEWEYACRAGTTTKFSFGDDRKQLGEYAWYRDNSGGTPHPVGTKRPNGWALYDIHGNVWEWCQDRYRDHLSTSVPDLTGLNYRSTRVLRGGSWNSVGGYCQSEYRFRNYPWYRGRRFGFRVAQVPLPAKKPASEANSESR